MTGAPPEAEEQDDDKSLFKESKHFPATPWGEVRHARDFIIAAERLMGVENQLYQNRQFSMNLFSPILVLLGFGYETLLKGLLRDQNPNEKVPRTHNLLKLFERLDLNHKHWFQIAEDALKVEEEEFLNAADPEFYQAIRSANSTTTFTPKHSVIEGLRRLSNWTDTPEQMLARYHRNGFAPGHHFELDVIFMTYVAKKAADNWLAFNRPYTSEPAMDHWFSHSLKRGSTSP